MKKSFALCILPIFCTCVIAITAAAQGWQESSPAEPGEEPGWERILFLDEEFTDGVSVTALFVPDGESLLISGCSEFPETNTGCALGAVEMVDLDSGESLWRTEAGDGLLNLLMPAGENWLAAGIAGDIVLINSDGEIIWAEVIDDGFLHTGAVSGNTALLADMNGSLYSVDLEDGEWGKLRSLSGEMEELEGGRMLSRADLFTTIITPHPDSGWFVGEYSTDSNTASLQWVDEQLEAELLKEDFGRGVALWAVEMLDDGNLLLLGGQEGQPDPSLSRIILMDPDGDILQTRYTGQDLPQRMGVGGDVLYVTQIRGRTTAWSLPDLEYLSTLPEMETVMQGQQQSEQYSFSTQPAISTNDMKLSPDGDKLLLCHSAGYVSVWQATPGQFEPPSPEPPVTVSANTFLGFSMGGMWMMFDDQDSITDVNDELVASGIRIEIHNNHTAPLTMLHLNLTAQSKDGDPLEYTHVQPGVFLPVGSETEIMNPAPGSWPVEFQGIGAEPLLLVFRDYSTWRSESGWDTPPDPDDLPDDPESLFELAETARENQNFATANVILDKIESLQLSPDDSAHLISLRALQYEHTGRIMEAYYSLAEALEEQPQSVPLNNSMGIFLLRNDSEDSALPYFETARENKPENVTSNFYIGYIKLMNGETEEGLELIRSIRDNPEVAKKPGFTEYIDQLIAEFE